MSSIVEGDGEAEECDQEGVGITHLRNNWGQVVEGLWGHCKELGSYPQGDGKPLEGREQSNDRAD